MNITIDQSDIETVQKEIDRSYAKDIQGLQAEYINGNSTEENLIKREQEYLEKLNEAIDKATNALEVSPNDESLLKKRKALEKEKKRVQIEIGELTQVKDQNDELISSVKNEILEEASLTQEEQNILAQSPSNEEEADQKSEILDKLLKIAERKFESTTNVAQKKAIKDEIERLNEEKRKVSFDFGDVEQSALANTNEEVKSTMTEDEIAEIQATEEEIKSLDEEKQNLQEKKEQAKDEDDAQKIEKKINKIEEKIAKEEVNALEITTEKSKDVVNASIASIDNESGVSSSDAINAKKSAVISEQLIAEAENTKDPVKKAELLKKAQEEQNKAIEKAEQEKTRRKAEILIGDISQSQELNNINEKEVTRTQQDIESEQLEISKQLLEVENSIASIDATLPKIKTKDQEELLKTREKLVNLKTDLKKKKQLNEDSLAEIKQQKQSDEEKGIADNAIEKPITYKEEVELAQSEEYKELSTSINRLKQKQFELNVKEEQLVELQNELKSTMNEVGNPEDPTEEEREKISNKLREIDEKKDEIKTLRNEVQESQNSVSERLPDDENKREKFENLLARDVAPIDEIPTLPVMSTGLVMGSSDDIKYDDENPIPLSEEKPGGLVYRVQIGAFSKPVPNETFNDFSPVSGEQVRPGLIRYMAGFFGSRNSATTARNSIRELGYNDAFVVAYCDGERVPLYRAEQLIASGACVPSIETPDNPIVSVDSADGGSQSSFEKELDEYAYNKAPGAAEAETAETKLGLYYTVQVGVYNTPVSADVLYNVSPLVTKRLDNGQIRYSSGVFKDIPAAREKRVQVIDKGITDAFITAYYKGERITISEAQKIIDQEGQEVFELNNPTQVKRNKVSSNTDLPDVVRDPYLTGKQLRMMISSSETFSSYPTQILNRYNEEAPIFYYDSISQKIKSFEFSSSDIPKGIDTTTFETHYYFRNYPVVEHDALDAKDALGSIDRKNYHLYVTIEKENISSEIMDAVWNAPVRKSMRTEDGSIVIHFIALSNESIIEEIKLHLSSLGVNRFMQKDTSFQQH